MSKQEFFLLAEFLYLILEIFLWLGTFLDEWGHQLIRCYDGAPVGAGLACLGMVLCFFLSGGQCNPTSSLPSSCPL